MVVTTKLVVFVVVVGSLQPNHPHEIQDVVVTVVGIVVTIKLEVGVLVVVSSKHPTVCQPLVSPLELSLPTPPSRRFANRSSC